MLAATAKYAVRSVWASARVGSDSFLELTHLYTHTLFQSPQEVKAYLDSIKSVGFSRINWN